MVKDSKMWKHFLNIIDKPKVGLFILPSNVTANSCVSLLSN